MDEPETVEDPDSIPVQVVHTAKMMTTATASEARASVRMSSLR